MKKVFSAFIALGSLQATVEAEETLAPLIVTATRSPQDQKNAAYSTALLSKDFLKDNQVRTVPEALQYTPGILVQKTAHGHGSPFIRGFTGRQNLLLVDGVRINNSTWRGGPVQYWNTVDPFSISRIELIRSQGSVLYGSDAAGGTLNAFTKQTDFRDREPKKFYQSGSAYYEYRSNGEGSHLGRLETEIGKGERFGILLGTTFKDFGDIEGPTVGEMRGTGYPEQNFDLKAQWAVSPESTLTFAHFYVNQDDVSRWHRTVNNPGWIHGDHVAAPGTFTANTYDQERSLSYLRYAGENPFAEAFIRRWNLTLSYQTTRDSEFQNRNPSKDDLRYADIDMSTLGFDLQLESELGQGTLVYGTDLYFDQVDSSGLRTDSIGSFQRESLPVADDSEYLLLGAFADYAWRATDALEISAGARYTHVRAELGRFYDTAGALQGPISESWNSVVGSLRGSWEFFPEWTVFGGISQAFRAPNLDDLSGNQSSKSGQPALGSVNVDPEKFITYELGLRHSEETTSFQASIFYTDVDDLIADTGFDSNGDGVADGSIATNASSAYSYGIELDGAWKFAPQWLLSGFVAWQEGRQEGPVLLGGPTVSKPVTRSYPLTGSLALRWTDESEKFWVEGRVLAAVEEDRITAADQAADNQRIPTHGTPGYVVGSLRAGWQASEYLELTAALENITDQDYRRHGSGQNEPGFGAVLGARLTW